MRAGDRPSRDISVIPVLLEYNSHLPRAKRHCSVMMQAIIQDLDPVIPRR
jgi:hypothetical protein